MTTQQNVPTSTALAQIDPRNRGQAIGQVRKLFTESKAAVLEATAGVRLSKGTTLSDEKEKGLIAAVLIAINEAAKAEGARAAASGTAFSLDKEKAALTSKGVKDSAKDVFASKMGDEAGLINLPLPNPSSDHEFSWLSEILYEVLCVRYGAWLKTQEKEGRKTREFSVAWNGGEGERVVHPIRAKERPINIGGGAQIVTNVPPGLLEQASGE